MSHQAHTHSDAPPIEAGKQVAFLRHLLGQIADDAASGYESLDEAARISVAYEVALPVARKRFDALAEETITWTKVALDALRLASTGDQQPRVAAAQLARELRAALRDLARTLQL